MNKIWMSMIAISALYAMYQGNGEIVSTVLFETGKNALELVVPLVCMNAFFNGILNIASACGFLPWVAKLFYPLMSRLFPDLKDDPEALGYISSNMTVNLFGLSNAATPFGLKAMQAMSRYSHNHEATRSMTTFLILNTSGITLFSTTLLSMRVAYHSQAPAAFLGTAFLVSLSSCVLALLIDRWWNYR